MMCRIFQHELDHLNGVVNWELESKGKQSTKELKNEEYLTEFY
jgi:peptide deformylase